jgi:hypothetical protein
MARPPSPDSKDGEYDGSRLGIASEATKPKTSLIDNKDVESSRVHRRALQAPELVLKMSAEERIDAENRLRRKIDFRLLPMVIIMYIMNYLDRNNIAAARIAGPDGKGLQDELGLSSTQYQVSHVSRLKSELFTNNNSTDFYQYSLCWILVDASSFQSHSQQDWSTSDLFTHCYDYLGYHIRRNRSCTKLCRSHCLSILSWLR